MKLHGFMGHHVGYPTVAAVAPFFSGFRRGAKPPAPYKVRDENPEPFVVRGRTVPYHIGCGTGAWVIYRYSSMSYAYNLFFIIKFRTDSGTRYLIDWERCIRFLIIDDDISRAGISISFNFLLNFLMG